MPRKKIIIITYLLRTFPIYYISTKAYNVRIVSLTTFTLKLKTSTATSLLATLVKTQVDGNLMKDKHERLIVV